MRAVRDLVKFKSSWLLLGVIVSNLFMYQMLVHPRQSLLAFLAFGKRCCFPTVESNLLSSWRRWYVTQIVTFTHQTTPEACVASMYLFHHGVLSNRNHIFEVSPSSVLYPTMIMTCLQFL